MLVLDQGQPVLTEWEFPVSAMSPFPSTYFPVLFTRRVDLYTHMENIVEMYHHNSRHEYGSLECSLLWIQGLRDLLIN